MTTKFMLVPQPGSLRYKLRKEGQQWERECMSVYEALIYVRSLPDSEGKPFVVLNKFGKELAEMTV
jgi:hypothetical protein